MLRYETWAKGLLQNIDSEKIGKLDPTSLENELSQWAKLFIDIDTWSRSDIPRVCRSCLGEEDYKIIEPSVVKVKDGVLAKLATVVPYLTTLLTLQCVEGVKLIRNVPAMYRRMNKEDPKSASYFVPTILQTLKSFMESYSITSFGSKFVTTVLSRVTIE